MGTYLTLRIYKGASPEEFRANAEHAALAIGARLKWDIPGEGDNRFSLRSDAAVHTLFISHPDSDFVFCEELGRQSELPWIELRIQEGSLWDYTLYQGADVADHFSPWPEYWEDPEEAMFREYKTRWLGKPEILSRLWGVPVERLQRYLVQWVPDYLESISKKKAYPGDRFAYGDYNQFYDMLTTLGGRDPRFDAGQHTLVLPK